MSRSDELYSLIRSIADSDDDFEAEGDTVCFVRAGREHTIKIHNVKGIGPAVEDRSSPGAWLSVETFLQRDVLELQRLAQQIVKTVDRRHKDSRYRFVDGPLERRQDGQLTQFPLAKSRISVDLIEPPFGVTQIIELMAPAGSGKSVLLEQISKEAALAYLPQDEPQPLLLVVDLLGRYVGTIHDAIAGSLNNDYSFPALSGRDVIAAVRKGWLALALDGFDELVARIGSREALLRTKELVDELEGAGVIILSARETFFEQYEIDASVRAYLQPNRGSYSICEYRLLPWEEPQALCVLRNVGSLNPEEDLAQLVKVFGNDTELLFRPFFISRLADAWVNESERFTAAQSATATRERIDAIIRVFLDRETEKWRSKSDSAAIDTFSSEHHIQMLAAAAGEMFRAGAFALLRDELEIAVEIGLNEMNVPNATIEAAKARVPTHAFLAVDQGRRTRFAHDTFYHYMLGHHVARAIMANSLEPRVLDAGELPAVSAEWALWLLGKAGLSSSDVVRRLGQVKTEHPRLGFAGANIARLVGLAARNDAVTDVAVVGADFAGPVLVGSSFRGTTFLDCRFIMADLSGASFQSCTFESTVFTNCRLDEATSFSASAIGASSKIEGIELAGESGLFDPDEIEQLLIARGAVFQRPPTPVTAAPVVPIRTRANQEVVRCLDKMRRSKNTDLSIDDFEERFPGVAHSLAQIGSDVGVFRLKGREASGAAKGFVRFLVGRDQLFEGQLGTTKNAAIDAFWKEVAKEFP